MLCQVCKKGLENTGKLSVLYYYKNTPVYGHHSDRESFNRSAIQGCVMCHDFPFNLNDPFNDSFDHYGNRRIYTFFSTFRIDNDEGRLCMTVKVRRELKMIVLVQLQKPLFITDTLNYNLGYSTDSMKTWSMIFKWISTCSQLHARCKRKPKGDKYRPTRLLLISKQQSSALQSNLFFQLVNGSHCTEGLSYVTLSYRWGTKSLEKSLRLLRSTETELEKPISTHHLPATLRDAIDIADRFGIQYIWIDRLCIYQDSMEDWHREALMMQDVYQNAALCISALGAVDDDGGCFFPRDPRLVAPTTIKLNGRDEVYRADREDTSWITTFQGEPLTQRAWVLQERLMSRRTIHFGSRQVYWECAEAHACETHPQGFDKFSPITESSNVSNNEEKKTSDSSLWKQLIATPAIPSTNKDPYARIYADWSAAVNLYSETKLTIPNDKLVAVSGLAKDVRRALQSLAPGQYRYLAGLWENVLVKTLVWYVQVGHPASRVCKYRAPSWSWASLDGRLFVPDAFHEQAIELATLQSADTVLASSDDTAEVNGGVLTLNGPTCVVEASAISSNQYTAKAFRPALGDRVVELQSRVHEPVVIYDTISDARDEIFCIWLVAQPAAVGKWQLSGLALSPVDDDIFERVGVVYYCHNSSHSLLEQFVGCFPRREITII